ncbi:MAG: hypothetical protein ACI837_002402 [Crocinitomicaceae bacterium]
MQDSLNFDVSKTTHCREEITNNQIQDIMKYLLVLPAFFFFACGDSTKIDDVVEKSDQLENVVSPKEEAEEICETLDSFVPKGWMILKKVEGDLNKDKIKDLVLVLMNTDEANVFSDEFSEIDSNPRDLLILFGIDKANCYRLMTKSSSFILAHEESSMDDPFEDIEISKGTLKLNFRSWYNMGSWLSSTYTYVWRFQDGDFKLIGANSSEFHRSTGDAVDVSVNFSTHKYSYSTSNMFDESVPEETNWKTFKMKELKTFSTFTEPWTFTLNDEVYL